MSSAQGSHGVIEFAKAVTGYYEPDELAHLHHFVSRLAPGDTVVEIGVEYGRSMSLILAAGQNIPLDIVLIDARLVNATAGHESTIRVMSDLGYERRPGKVRDYAFSNGVSGGVFLETTSIVAHAELPLFYTERQIPPVGLLHIDADHGEGVHADVALWAPHVRPGGWVAFHDYDRRAADGETLVFPEVKKAVDLLAADPQRRWGRPHVVNTLAVLERRAIDATETGELSNGQT